MTPHLASALRLDSELRPVRDPGFLEDVLSGLSQRRKTIPPKYFYDVTGSRLFDRICALPEYYPTRTETTILQVAAPAIAHHAGPDAVLVEFGSGSSTKVRILLDALERPRAYVPIDISGEHMRQAARDLQTTYPALKIVPVEADFTQGVDLPTLSEGKRIGFFPGSTIGNLTPADAARFLQRAAETLGPGSDFIVGVDLRKHGAILHAAYNDREGVTAAFNLNLLSRINRELGADFNVKAFRHRAFYDAAKGRIEMHLESLKPQSVMIAGDRFSFRQDETIHTESSYKYTISGFQDLAVSAGWQPADCFVDEDRLFSVHYLTR